MRFITTLLLLFSFLSAYCQNNDASSSSLNEKIATIDAYANDVDHNSKLSPVRIFDYGEFKHFNIYTKTDFILYGTVTQQTLKSIAVTQNTTTCYFKNGKLIYKREISADYNNYSNIKTTYLEHDSVINSTTRLAEEHILQIKCIYNGAEEGGNFTLTITKDSINYSGRKIIARRNSGAKWTKMTSLLNLSDFDKIETTKFWSYIDGHDLSYYIITDMRTHCFVNASGTDPAFKKLGGFFKEIQRSAP